MFIKSLSCYIIVILSLISEGAHGTVLIRPMEALKSIYPSSDRVVLTNILITPTDVKKIEKLGRTKINDRIFRFYKVYVKNKIIGYGAIYSQKIRTKSMAILHAISPQGDILGSEIIAFHEPTEYQPNKKWLQILAGKNLDDHFRVGGDIPRISGATLSARAVAKSVRIVLSVWKDKFTSRSGT